MASTYYTDLIDKYLAYKLSKDQYDPDLKVVKDELNLAFERFDAVAIFMQDFKNLMMQRNF